MDKKFIGANPILPVMNVTDTACFFEKELGFNIETIWKEPPYGVVKRDEAIVEFGEGRKEIAGSGICFIHVANADQIYKEFQQKNIEFVGDIADRDYGSRDFRVKDNNRNILIIGHALDDQSELLRKSRIA